MYADKILSCTLARVQDSNLARSVSAFENRSSVQERLHVCKALARSLALLTAYLHAEFGVQEAFLSNFRAKRLRPRACKFSCTLILVFLCVQVCSLARKLARDWFAVWGPSTQIGAM